ncbi:LIC20153 family lipoprotein [Leptospira bourretii]|uniref:LIC20153 family lipoprotein n=1 Tax=Leptospira bourretii TaxID=2484962 RepID=UPI001FCAA55D|nr:hypothetical protein [Leptospira bourretii]
MSLVAGFSFQCEKKEEDNSDLLALAAVGSLFSSAGDCNVSAPPRSSINTWSSSITANGTATVSKIGSVPVVGHQTAALKITAKNGTNVAISGNTFVIVYQTSACPLASSTRTGFTTTSLSDTTAEFTNSYTVSGSGSINFTVANDYYIFLYAIPSRGQAASVTYTVTGL